ncbi:hypothetical protein ACJW31_06G044600 [Castanea mollissima]
MFETGSKPIRKRSDAWYEVESAEDILADILSRVPIKSLLAFKSVSKQWRRLIQSSTFIKLQLRWSLEKPNYLIYPYMDGLVNLYHMKGNGEIIEKITLFGCEDIYSLSLLCSCNGLLCFINYPFVPDSNRELVYLIDFDIRICNPATREVYLLPKGSPSEKKISIGVAFGPKPWEYKVFRFFHPKYDSDDIKCEVYSSITGSWRGIGDVQYCPIGILYCPLGSNHVYVNGKIYWFLPEEGDIITPGSILSVDIEENFKVISLPDEVTAHAFLVDLEGFLSLVAVYDDDQVVDVWILHDSNESNWEKKCSDYVPFSCVDSINFVAARKTEIFFITSDQYLIYNLDDGTWTELDFADDFESNLPVVLPYTESLLPCNGILGSEGEHNLTL